MLGATEVVTAPVPWSEIVYVGAAIVAALGAFIAIPTFIYFLKDRKRILLRQEVQDETRRREQLEVRVEELTKQRDADRNALAEERKRPDVNSIALTLEKIALTLESVIDGNAKILDKLASLNGGLAHANDGLQATRTTLEFLAQQIVLRDPNLLATTPPPKQ